MPQNLLNKVNLFNPFRPQQPTAARPMDDYVPQREMQDRFNSHLDNMPQLNKPSKFKSIMGALAALNSDNPQATADSIKHAPYMRAMEQWKSLNPVLNTAVDNERDYNTNQRILRRDDLNEQYRRDDLLRRQAVDDQRAKEGDARIASTDRQNAIRQQLADIRALAEKKPNTKSFVGEDGFVNLIDLDNPTAAPIRTSIKTGELSDVEKLSIGLENSLQVARERGEQARATAGVVGEQNRLTRSTPTPGTNGNAELETTRGRVNRANQVRSQYPELDKYISIEGNTVTIPELRKPMFGQIDPTEAANRQRAYDLIFGGSNATPPRSATIAAPFPVAGPRPTNPVMPTTGVVNFERGGQMYAIPAARAQAFMQQFPDAVRK